MRVLIILLVLVSSAIAEETVIQVGDTVLLRMPIPDGQISNFYRVGDGGTIDLPYIGKVKVVGLNREEAARAIDDSYLTQGVTSRRMAAVSIGGPEPYILMMGELKRPARIAFRPELTLLEAVREAGGFADTANQKRVKLERVTSDRTVIIDVTKLIQKPALDIPLIAGDKVTVMALQK